MMIDPVANYIAKLPPSKILIVEDDPYISNMYYQKLQREHFQVMVADNGQAGLRLAQQELPDLILLDVMLPKVDGWSVLEYLKANANTRNIPIIMLTNLGTQQDMDQAKRLGADEYMVKAQYLPSEVVTKIKTLLA